MTKTKKRIIVLSLVFGLILSFCSFFFSSNKANADTFSNDENLFFGQVNTIGEIDNESNTLSFSEFRFNIIPKSDELTNLHNFIGNYNIEIHETNYFLFEFMVYADYSSEALSVSKQILPIKKYRFLFAMTYGGGNNYMHSFMSAKNYNGFSETVNYLPSQKENVIDTYEKGSFRKKYWRDLLLSDGFSEVYHITTSNTGLIFNEDNGMLFKIINPERNVKYGVKVSYDFHYSTKRNLFSIFYATKTGEFDTDSISPIEYSNKIVKEYGSYEAIEEYVGKPGFGELLKNYNEQKEEKEVTVSYLKQIEGTPFATMVSTTIKLVFRNGYAFARGDFYKAMSEQKGLNLEEIDCVLGSYLNTFFSKDGKNYKATYLTGGRARVITADGNYVDWFADINKSFSEFYGPFEQCSLLESPRLEVYLNNLVFSKYKDLSKEGFTASNIYGYWGFVGVPETHTINTFIVNFENTDTYFDSVYGLESYDALITKYQYEELMTTYNYTWLFTQWSSLINKLGTDAKNATFYMYYLEKNDNALIGEGGQTDYDDGSVVQIKVQKGWQKIKEFLSDFSLGKSVKIVLFAVLALLLSFGILKTIRVVKKAKYSNNSSNNKNNKRK